MEGSIIAKIFSLTDGYKEIDNIKLIKIKSKNYSIAIMEDYLPAIDEVDGDVSFIGDGFEINYENINGFYKNAHNIFELLIKQEKND